MVKLKGKIEINSDRCKGCLLCINVCPNKVISISDDFNLKGVHYAKPSFMEKCTGCALCAIICPDVAITVYKEEN